MESQAPAGMSRISGPGPRVRAAPVNASLPWDSFDTSDYLQHNYVRMRDDDQQIVGIDGPVLRYGRCAKRTRSRCRHRRKPLSGAGHVAGVFDDHARGEIGDEPGVARRRGAATVGDLGSVRQEVTANTTAAGALDPRTAMAARVRITPGDIYDLPCDAWDLGTMLFVAESITDRWEEFALAIRAFVESLSVDAPFVAAFMENSQGYRVGSEDFGAVAVDAADLSYVFAPWAHHVDVHPIHTSNRLRAGYDGMLLVTGWRRAQRRSRSSGRR